MQWYCGSSWFKVAKYLLFNIFAWLLVVKQGLKCVHIWWDDRGLHPVSFVVTILDQTSTPTLSSRCHKTGGRSHSQSPQQVSDKSTRKTRDIHETLVVDFQNKFPSSIVYFEELLGAWRDKHISLSVMDKCYRNLYRLCFDFFVFHFILCHLRPLRFILGPYISIYRVVFWKKKYDRKSATFLSSLIGGNGTVLRAGRKIVGNLENTVYQQVTNQLTTGVVKTAMHKHGFVGTLHRGKINAPSFFFIIETIIPWCCFTVTYGNCQGSGKLQGCRGGWN